ncbi:mammalian cell entry protein [Mycobacterium sp. E342]|nr:mammalian cell entry protein [Mycobacterium sp. E3247]OBH32098.1 mammalian cell entry protein [Mycobacterium sp. E342]
MADGDDESGPSVSVPRTWPALVIGLVAVVALGGLGGWLGYGVYRDRQDGMLRAAFLTAGRQGALNLTTIDYTHADADVQRILDSSTGQFREDFSKHAPAFIDVVKRAQSKTHGSITDAGLESSTGESARVLVAVSVNTTNVGASDQAPRHWRMRVDVQKVGDTMKVSNVGFVP